ncbi:MAG TPA: family 43 glycosylhydrolase [Kofleriaceae bacterium]
MLVLVAAAACATPDDPMNDVTDDDLLLATDAKRPFHGRFGSPTIVRDGDKLHAYFAIQAFEGERVNVTHARSDDNGKTWLRIGEALPRLNQLAVQTGSVWAPGAAKIADGRWMIYYTAVLAGTEHKMCIYRAHATSAHGPFVDDFGGPLVCPDGTLWALDAYPVRDAHGNWHLVARIDEPGGNNTTSMRRLGEHGKSFADGSKWEVLTRINLGGWEEPVMENAAMVRLDANGEKRWYVFYSGGSYRNNTYAVGYADCGPSIHGPCVKKTVDKPWLESRPDLDMFGPGTPTFYKDENGDVMMAVNTWEFSGGQENPKNNGQIMHLFKVKIGAGGKPVATFVRKVE